MLFSLNCLISEQTPNDILNVPISEFFTSEGKVDIKFTDMTVANFKEQLYRTKEVKEANITKMNIYKVELKLDSLEDNKSYTEDDINGTIMKPGCDLNEYFNDAEKKPKKGHLHIFIVSTSTGKCLPTFYLSNKRFAVETMIFIFVSHLLIILNMLYHSPLDLERKRPITEEEESKKRVIETWYHT